MVPADSRVKRGRKAKSIGKDALSRSAAGYVMLSPEWAAVGPRSLAAEAGRGDGRDGHGVGLQKRRTEIDAGAE